MLVFFHDCDLFMYHYQDSVHCNNHDVASEDSCCDLLTRSTSSSDHLSRKSSVTL